MTTTQDQFEQRLKSVTDPWVTRKDVEHLAGASPSTVRKWLAAHPIPADKTRTGPRSVQLIERETAAHWVRARLFPPPGEGADRPSGPRLAAEVRRLTYVPGERWRWADIARRRGVTPGAISNLGRTYADHPERPFPPVGDDRKRDAKAVSDWFLWYDTVRPGYADRSDASSKE